VTPPPQSTDGRAVDPVAAFDVSLRLPGSKSLVNRVMLLAALSPGNTTVTGVPAGDDSDRMIACLRMLGPEVHTPEAGCARVHCTHGGITAPEADLDVGNAGTVARFLTAACCLGPRDALYRIDGVARMRQRPIGTLVEAMRALGATIDYLGEAGYLPLHVSGGGVRGGCLTLPTTASSQFISALLIAAPRFTEGLDLTFHGPVTSRPYVAMTLTTMAAFGVRPQVDDAFTRIKVDPGSYAADQYAVEPDASNASYFLAAAAIVPGSRCTVEGLGRRSPQGDVAFADLLHEMGAGLVFGPDFITVSAPPETAPLQGIDVDLNAMPDMVQTLAAVALFAQGPTRIRNVGNLRVKETDRLTALASELTRVGATVTVDGDDLTIEPPAENRPASAAIETYDDHRMAMCFSVVGLRVPGIVILNPDCVNKTFPDFFQTLAHLAN